MKKHEAGLETRIVETALRLFNESGIEYVGMRELATVLGIRIGNLNYYFPTKDDLVYRISLELAQENARTIVAVEHITLPAFFDMVQQVFDNHVKFRCLMLSFVHIVQRNAAIAKRYSKTQSERSETWEKNVRGLVASKEIKATKSEIDFLVSTISLIARFWISEAVVSFRNEPEEIQKKYYVAMIARIFLPYATARGRKFLLSLLAA
jgi:AcrR family transcriptional regulator